ncbi:MAG: hypothetical protein GX198_03740 [Epulopiscium sp.]|jgi:hypothetical protein|nr:hypothetical protein [Candidatus Epulonipiscium sp.]HPT75318.1 hypothetical protein [Defluviitaleaceae bacterium]
MRDIGAFFYYVKNQYNQVVTCGNMGVEPAFVLDFLPAFIFPFLLLPIKSNKENNYSLYCFF